MSRQFVADPGQKFACRDCPARCCRMPWRITATEAEKERILALEWVPARLASSGSTFGTLDGGRVSLPILEKNRLPQCLFLDDDGLCSIHKREGVGATPQTCQTFPFGFIEHEDGSWETYLSHLCPSIRDNYGESLAPKLPEIAGRMEGMAPFKLVPQLRLGQGHIRQADYLAWAKRAAQLLAESSDPPSTLIRIQAWTGTLAAGVSLGQVYDGKLVETEMPAAGEVPLALPKTWARSTRLLLATCFLPVSYPSRVAGNHGPLKRTLCRLASLNFVRRMAGQKESVDVLFLEKPADLAGAFSIPSAINSPECRSRLARFLGRLLLRRNFFFSEKSLEDIAFLLALTGSIICVFARMKAASEGRSICVPHDLAEGESMAEFLLTYHGSMVQSQKALEILTGFMATYPPAFRGLVETF